MDKKKIIIISISSLLSFILLFIIIAFYQTKNSYQYYKTALEKYNNSEFNTAKKNFKKVSRLSKLKPAAVFREATCANKVQNKQEEVKQYERLKNFYPQSKVTPRAVFLAGKINYHENHTSKALKEFKLITKRYPKTKYAIASNYYIALIESEKDKIKPQKEREIINRAKKYIIEAPDGLYALNCVKIMERFTLSDEEKILVGKVYLLKNDYNNAEKYFTQTDITISWPYLVQVYFEKKDYEKVRNFTKLGLSTNTTITSKEHNNACYKAIDLYIRTFDNNKTAVENLLNIGDKNRSYDYILYKKCQISSGESKNICYNSVYQIYPHGNFAAESLANVFYDAVKNQNYSEAIKLGNYHLLNYKNTKSTPKVLYWMAYVTNKENNPVKARQFYEKLMMEYPDDYYTYLAFTTVNGLKYGLGTTTLTPKPVLFPYAKTNDVLLSTLLEAEDFGLISKIYDDDDFIRSWLLYKSGNYTTSTRLARDAMDKLNPKPEKDDLRWRLVYPIMYYDELNNNPTSDKTIILSIIREESYFNPMAKSSAGAMGLMQLMPKTAVEIAHKTGFALTNTDLLYDAKTNIKLGILYYNFLKNTLGRSQYAILAYNGGIGSVKRWKQDIEYNNFDDFVENIPYSETQNYYKKIFRTYWNYLRIYNGLNF